MSSPEFSPLHWLESHPKLKNIRLVRWITSHWELVTYAFFGGLTTVVDWTVRFILYGLLPDLPEFTLLIGVIAWIAAVLFAFVTNKLFVFGSKTRQPLRVLAELGIFAGGRVASLCIQELLMYLTAGVIGWDRRIMIIPIAVLVVVINYFLTKFVFRKKTDGK
ncbi:MAG: GtrA family protein [Clostridia bacterium]|nr:GtrA family protein [Clostridia bacterium]